ncbi:unnamed protein product [Pelagomonas calceolata]|uniref:Uncharacterized protein n=2 Tax=Pelagomonas calceolata TaxID=35677 RepID=A0A8J2SFF4_9STRA|nr:unnamed protein product [Pelagomonas calceolata]
MGTGLSRPDGSPINFGDADDDIREASERLLKEWKEEQKKADAAEAQRQAELDEKQREWTAYLNSPEYAAEQQKKRKQLEDAFQVLRRRFLREHGARFGLEVPPPSSSDDDEDDDDEELPKRPFNPQGGAMLEAASRVLADPDAPRSRQEAVEQVMAATEALAAGRGLQEAVAASGRRALASQKRKRSAHPLKRKMRQRAGRSDDAAGGAAGAAAPGRAAALRERVKAKRRARRSPP